MRIAGPDRQDTHATAANKVAVVVHAHICNIFWRNKIQRRWRLVSQITLINRHCPAGSIQFGRLVVITAYPGDGHRAAVNACKPGIYVIVGSPCFPCQMQVRVFRPKLTTRTTLYHLLHGP
ncbi:Uncharacterised protein [Shigella flexneri]|nr:Uncharacterised protein [Shigella flexneri]